MTQDPNGQTPMRMDSSEVAPIDPQIRRFVSELMQSQTRDTDTTDASFEEMRRRAEVVRARWHDGGPAMAATQDMQVPTVCGEVHVRLYRPCKSIEPHPALIYLHGGGWTMFSIDTHERVMRELAARAGVVVIGIDYALSPEAKFPFALHQIEGVVRWVASHANQLEVDPKRLAIGGDSAGANLAVGVSLLLRDAGDPGLLQGMLLFYGCFTNVVSERSANGYGAEGNLLSSAEMEGYWRNYLATPADALDPLASPLLARLEGLPPTFQVIAQCDVLAEQNAAFAIRLREAGVAAEKHEYVGATHSFLEAVSIADVAGRALDDSATWLRKYLHVSL
ncbi:MAG: alpha/beta hydrolase fold domain-containing protein [Rhodanobacter sp.]